MKKLKLQKNNYNGKLIVFEGVDGSGKTTLLNLASEYFRKQNIPHITLKMPSDFIRKHPVFNAYDNSLDDTTRKIINLEHLTTFVMGDRLITLEAQIIPALKQGLYVLCDRYCFTGYMHCPTKLIRALSNKFVKPNLVIMPVANKVTLKNRIQQRENEKNNYYNEQNVINQILKFNVLAKKHHFTTINTEQEQAKINNELYSALNKVFS